MRLSNALMAGLILCTIMGMAYGTDIEGQPAELNGYAPLAQDTGNHILRVNTGNKTVQALEFEVMQGNPDTLYTVDRSLGKGAAKRVGDVMKETGSVLYRIIGRYAVAGGGGGGRKISERWDAKYGYGGLRLLLSINDPSPNDDFVALKDAFPGAILTIKLVGEPDDAEHEVTFDSPYIALSEENPKLGLVDGVWISEKKINIRGTQIGETKIWAVSENVQGGRIEVDVYKVVFLLQETEKTIVQILPDESLDMEIKVYGSTAGKLVPITMKEIGTVTSLGAIPGNITVNAGAEGGGLIVFGPGNVSAATLVVQTPANELNIIIVP